MKAGSLFTGIGGLDLGLGVPPAFMCEYDPHCRAVLEQHYPGVPIVPDIHDITADNVPPIDVLHGGYPCQPFSTAGLRKGEDDPRHLWPQFARLIRVLRPRIVVAENVSGHLRLGFDTVLADLAGMGFDVRWGVVRASDAGAPHQRARLFVVATDPAHIVGADEPRVDGHEPAVGDAVARAGARARAGDLAEGVRDVGRGPREIGGAPADARSERPHGSGERHETPPAAGRGDRGAGAAGPAALAPDAAAERRAERGPEPSGREGQPIPERDRAAAPDAARERPEGLRHGPAEVRRQEPPIRDRCAAPDADGGRRPLDEEQLGRRARLGTGRTSSGDDADGRSDEAAPDADGAGREAELAQRNGSRTEPAHDVGDDAPRIEWGVYEPAIRRWELIIGRAAPRPVDDRGRLEPAFAEWMMGFPAGWTDSMRRTHRLKAVGNAVCPQQADLAMRLIRQ